jgi:hypothetical protein
MFYYQLHRNIKDEEEQRALEELILDPKNDYNIRDDAELLLKLVLMKTRGVSERTKEKSYILNKGG